LRHGITRIFEKAEARPAEDDAHGEHPDVPTTRLRLVSAAGPQKTGDRFP